MSECSNLSTSSPAIDEPLHQATKRRVHFNERVLVQRTISIDEMTDEEMDKLWFFQEDFDNMRRRERKLSITAEEAPPPHREVLQNIYGIECPSQKSENDDRVRQYALSILIEQERQWTEGRVDSFLLASLSQHLTFYSRKAAQTRGEQVSYHLAASSLTEKKLTSESLVSKAMKNTSPTATRVPLNVLPRSTGRGSYPRGGVAHILQ